MENTETGTCTEASSHNLNVDVWTERWLGGKKWGYMNQRYYLWNIIKTMTQGCVQQEEFKVSGFRKRRPSILSWSRVSQGRCNQLVGWWRWRRSVLPSRTGPVVSLGPVQTGNLQHTEGHLNRNPEKNTDLQRHATQICTQGKKRKILPPTNASPAPFVSTMSLGSIFNTGNVSTLSSEQTRDKRLRHARKKWQNEY